MILRLIRGGSYLDDTWYLHATYRIRDVPVSRYRYYGFRLVVRGSP